MNLKTSMLSAVLLGTSVASAQNLGGSVTPATPATTTAGTTKVTPAAPVGVVTLTDVPAGHWARAAIAVMLEKGLLLGYPDGTYRGSQGITRYEAATIFARLLESGALDRAKLGQDDMTTIAKGVQEVAEEIVSIGTRVSALEVRDSGRDARLNKLESQLTQMATLLGSALPETSNAAGRLAAVEQAVTTLPGVLAGKATVDSLNAVMAQNAALTAQLADLNTRQAALEAKLAAQDAQTAAKAGFPAPLPEPTPTPVVPRRLSVGLSGEGTLVGSSGLRYGAAVDFGAADLLGPVGLRASAYSRPTASAFGVDLALSANIGNFGGLMPYAGLGIGSIFSPSRADVNSGTHDLYALGLIGLNYAVSDSLNLFGEGNGRYYFSNTGYGTGLPSGQSGVGLNVRAGLRFQF